MARMTLRVFLIFAVGLPTLASADDLDRFRHETREFQQAREAALRAPDGWLSVADLIWLQPGKSEVGSAPSAAVRLPAQTPTTVGTLTLSGDDAKASARFQPASGVPVLCNGQPFDGGTIHSDVDGGKADVLAVGEVRLILLRRNDRFAVRVKDNASATRAQFGGCRWFEPDPTWRVIGRFTPHPIPKTVSFETIVGGRDVLPSPGTVAFDIDGRTYTLEAAAEPDGKLWFVFRDATAGTSTAANARQLTTDAPIGDVVILDFNRAINLPCAYIDHATCPIAPTQNRLALPIPAGERLPAPAGITATDPR